MTEPVRTRVFYIRDEMLGAGYRQTFQVKAGDYRYACTILATDPEDVFAKMNRGSGREVPQLDLLGLRSLSVGDVIYMHDIYYVCAIAGWTPLGPGTETHQLYLKAVEGERSPAPPVRGQA